MSEGWEPGDVAVCVDAGWRGTHLPCPSGWPLVTGRSYTVSRVGMAPQKVDIRAMTPAAGTEILSLIFLEAKNPAVCGPWFAADRFVKRRSLLEEEERETSEALTA